MMMESPKYDPRPDRNGHVKILSVSKALPTGQHQKDMSQCQANLTRKGTQKGTKAV